MSDIYDYLPETFSEIYEIVKTAIVWHRRRCYKIEILYDPLVTHERPFSSNVYVELKCRADIYQGEMVFDYLHIWEHLISFPWVKSESSDGAMGQTLGFLSERYKKD